jgi:EAL domain-containing protein (putative c-di-GMP-specific phosphodiesterase class I)
MEFQLSIDDFGTGASNLERLRWYPFTELKIDRSFLNDVSSENSSDWIIVRNAMTMGQQLGLEIVAEGVEDTRTLRRLRELGCDRAQGYLISPPVPAADFADRVQAWSQTAESLFA